MSFGATDCITYLGTRGTGKSSLARKFSEAWPRIIVIDPVKDWDVKKIPGAEIIYDFNNFCDKMEKIKYENIKSYKIIFRFNPETPNKQTVFDQVLRIIFNVGNCQLIIDEIQLFSSPHFASENLKNIIFIGRHEGISLACITQRPGQLNKSILAESLHVFVGQLHEKNDLRVISDFMNIDQEKIINLPKGSFFHFSPGEKIKLIKLF